VVAAAKTFGAEAVRELIEAGGRDIGENYVQEAAAKVRAVGAGASVRWHLIGRLQRNKARAALEIFDLVHSLDHLDLASALDRAASLGRRRARCLVEVNVGGEATKGGVRPDDLPGFLVALAPYPALSVEGLMAIPPPGSPADSRRAFARVRELAESARDLRLPNVQLKELSMGMSGDFEEAIAEGATIVRIGTAIFGSRTKRDRPA
jgi:pyridoxal phosphate enzyme (YggS family)